ncbi:L-gulonolactone/D-arabinono-1,4-lactone oxidase [Cubamyces menziesii]|nr:L-gulonolactone/D-arabinono-1,4-lactone oxidase [Cubamyces menziesii]
MSSDVSSRSHPAVLPTQKMHDIPLSTLYELLAPVTVRAGQPKATFINWGLSYTCTPLCVFEPETEEQCRLVLELARREGKSVRVAGIGHSPSDLVCTTGFMLRTEKLKKVIEVNVEKRYVVAQAGVVLNDLHVLLARHGLAMRNLGSISDQTIGGVITTATHGSGMNWPVLSMHVLALVILLADGSRVRCSRQERPDLFLASICGIGATGLILEITLEVEPAFRLKEVQENHSFDEVVQNLDTIARSAEHVRLWWFPQADVVRVSTANRTSEPRKPVGTWLWHSVVGFHLLQFLLFVARYIPILNIYVGRFMAWLVRDRTVTVDDSYRVYNIDCKYPQYTTEWAIPYDHAQACLREVRAWLESEFADPAGLRPHSSVEIRFSCPDDIWLSPSYGQQTCWIGLVQFKPYGLNVPYRQLFARFEALMLAHGGTPHWAKTHPLGPDALRARYPRFDDFVRVLDAVDPHGLFRNPYVERHIFGRQGAEFGPRVFKKLP